MVFGTGSESPSGLPRRWQRAVVWACLLALLLAGAAARAEDLRQEWQVGQDRVAPEDLRVIPPVLAPDQLSLDDALLLALRQNAGFRRTVQGLLAARSDWYTARQRWAVEALGQVEKAGNGETDSSMGAALSYAAITGADFSVTAELARLDDEEQVRTLSAALRQPLLAGAGPASEAYEALRSARNGYRAGLLTFFSDRQDLMERIISAYYDVAEQRELARVQDASVALAEQAVDYVVGNPLPRRHAANPIPNKQSG